MWAKSGLPLGDFAALEPPRPLDEPPIPPPPPSGRRRPRASTSGVKCYLPRRMYLSGHVTLHVRSCVPYRNEIAVTYECSSLNCTYLCYEAFVWHTMDGWRLHCFFPPLSHLHPLERPWLKQKLSSGLTQEESKANIDLTSLLADDEHGGDWWRGSTKVERACPRVCM